MHIVLCGSMSAHAEMSDIANQLMALGHTVIQPEFMQGESPDEHQESANHKITHDLIRRYFKKIQSCDALLVVNVERKGIHGYIGGNAFLEMGFGYVLEKPIYLWQDIPQMGYADEIVAMRPTVIHEDITKIQP